MTKRKTLAAFALLAAASAVHAEWSSTWTLTNDYDFRGASQSAQDPALQGTLDFSADSGWYAGAWASNVDFDSDVDIEVDLYSGFAGGEADGLGWDVGVVYYAYPDDSDLNYPEIYGKLSYGMFSGGLFYSNDWLNSGQSAFYTSADARAPLAGNWFLLAHAGYSFGDWWDEPQPDAPGSDYIDYSAGVGYMAGNFELALKWVDTTLEAGDVFFSGEELFNTEGRLIFTIATTFPWNAD